MSKQNLIVIGNGMVGHTLLESLVAGGAQSRWNILVFCEEPRVAYNRMALSDFFKGKTAQDLSLVKDNFYETFGIQVLVGESATIINPVDKTVTSAKGAIYNYDKLVLATGSFPFVPPVAGGQGSGCFVYRTIEDLEAIKTYAKGCKRGVVVGGGLLGLEAAQALLNMNIETHVVEFAPRLMALQLDDAAAKVLLKHVESMGVHVHLSKNTSLIDRNESSGNLSKMKFADGGELETEMIVFSAGVRPRDQIARESGIKVGPRGGVEINNFCQTNFGDIYAVGEVALHNGRIYGLVAPGNQMARVCAAHLLGRESEPFLGADMSTKLKVVGCEVAVIGDSIGAAQGLETFVYGQSSKGIYKKLITNAAMDKVIGGIFVGDTTEYNNVLSIMLNDLPVPKEPESLILPQTAGSSKMGGVELLPPTAKICSCHNVSKGDLCCAIKNGALDIEALKACTKAGTGCGGCVPMITELLAYEKSQMGIETHNYLCEHFKMSRQELCHLVMVKQLRDFESVLEQCGRGRGCEICKPAVASILAHTWGDHIHRPDLVVLQDTNDAFLGNMQRDGTYSVVPRTPGGEILPQQLEFLGKLGQKYGLYTKITGAQRLDFFGAQVHQLPDIWDELTKEGFETGHAYAKALRAVKSCVGSTWCRYGVQDSVTMAIVLENRYKGIRMPHKFKMAVSGCTRECAEAQGKDVGLIAVKGGYNIYVCGNGGMKPKHAELLATDVAPDMALKLIDRFVMFYCRTADRLQRTARWLEGLEGGLDYLKSVIMEDSLGICKELEDQLQRLVEVYQNEWATTIQSPEQVRRFKTFINLPADQQNDPNLKYEVERGQVRLPTLMPANPYPLPEPKAHITIKQDGRGTKWEPVCPLEEIPLDSGACALVDGVQIAVFRTKEGVFALHNYDPFSEAHVLSRGLVGDKNGVLKVASPLYKHNFALETGVCLTKKDVAVPTYPVRVHKGIIQVQSTPCVLPLSAA